LQLPTRIFGYYVGIRYNGVPINRDLVLDVDGHRCLLPSGFVIAGDRHTTPAARQLLCRSATRSCQLVTVRAEEVRVSGNGLVSVGRRAEIGRI